MKCSEMAAKIRRLLGDSTGDQFDNDLVLDGIQAALVAILPWVSYTGTTQVIGDATAISSVAVPPNFYRMIAVYDQGSGFYLPQENMTPAFNSSEKRKAYNAYFEYPDGFVSFVNAIQDGVGYNLYYSAQWPIPQWHVSTGSTDPIPPADDDLPTPGWIGLAIAFYSASYAAMQKAAQAGNIRQYNVTVDSGNPIQNPWADMSREFLARFKYEISLVPVQIKGIK